MQGGGHVSRRNVREFGIVDIFVIIIIVYLPTLGSGRPHDERPVFGIIKELISSFAILGIGKIV